MNHADLASQAAAVNVEYAQSGSELRADHRNHPEDGEFGVRWRAQHLPGRRDRGVLRAGRCFLMLSTDTA
ncbi:MAG: hypothetical protein V8T86_02245 [Victivallis sp.]